MKVATLRSLADQINENINDKCKGGVIEVLELMIELLSIHKSFSLSERDVTLLLDFIYEHKR